MCRTKIVWNYSSSLALIHHESRILFVFLASLDPYWLLSEQRRPGTPQSTERDQVRSWCGNYPEGKSDWLPHAARYYRATAAFALRTLLSKTTVVFLCATQTAFYLQLPPCYCQLLPPSQQIGNIRKRTARFRCQPKRTFAPSSC
jgi:hypothetical protein